MSVCLSVRGHIGGITCTNLTKFSLHDTRGHCSVLLLDSFTICDVFPVLWITSNLPRICRAKATQVGRISSKRLTGGQRWTGGGSKSGVYDFLDTSMILSPGRSPPALAGDRCSTSPMYRPRRVVSAVRMKPKPSKLFHRVSRHSRSLPLAAAVATSTSPSRPPGTQLLRIFCRSICSRLIKPAFHDSDTDTDILARIVARMSACRATCPFSLPQE